MECTLSGLTPEECLIFLDDIIVYTSSFDDHLPTLEEGLPTVATGRPAFEAKKCHLAQPEVHYLGHIVSRRGVCPNPENLRLCRVYLGLTISRNFETFLGITNYYQ